MSAYLIVRAEVPQAMHRKFDHWYEGEHLPDGLREFKALSAKRGWSSIDPSVHFAFYEFADLSTAITLLNSDVMKEFIAEFDRQWDGKIERTRDVVEIVQSV